MLHANHSYWFFSYKYRDTQERSCTFTDQLHSQLPTLVIHIPVDHQRLTALNDFARNTLTPLNRIDVLSVLIWEVDNVVFLIEQGNKRDISSEYGTNLFADQFDKCI